MFKFSFFALLLLSLSGLAQQTKKTPLVATSTISGKVIDSTNSGVIPFASILLFKDNVNKASATTDMNGEYSFKNLTHGNYKIIASYVGYTPKTITGISVTQNKTVVPDIQLSGHLVRLSEVTITEKIPMVQMESISYNNISVQEYSKAPAGGRHYKKSKEKGDTYSGKANAYDYDREGYSRIYDNEFKDSKHDPLSTFSIDVDKASYSNVRRFLTQGQLPQPDAVRVEEMINYFSYNYPQPKEGDPFSITTEYTECPWNNKHSLIHIGLQGKEIKLDNLPANNLTFLIDVSGSMSDEDKLPLLKSGLHLLVEQMRPQDKVSIVVYAGAAGVVLPPTSGEYKERIYEAMEKLQSGGSTAGGEGIMLAYKTAKENFIAKGNNRIILATDGDFNVGISSDGELTRLIEKEREDGVFLSVLGFGTGNYQDSKMEQLADKGNGNYAYIDNLLEAKKVLVKEMGGTLLTIAKDVKLQIEFNPAKVKAYRLVGYENRMLNKEDFNDDKKDAGELGSGHTVTAIYEIIPAGSSELVASTDALKYQETKAVPESSSNEVMTIKFRYKEPKESTSKLMAHIVADKKTAFDATSENCKFAVAVAEFGMLLRDSKFKGDSDFKSIMKIAKSAKGNDDEGYRAEFIKLVETAELLKK
ncbi:MAG: von Willebrand factor type A domain-containing protein [Bacteroidota bacterium]